MPSRLTTLQEEAQTAVRRFGLAALGVGLSLVGAGFLTELLWRYIAAHSGAMAASLSLGCIFLACGAAVLVVASRRGKPVRTQTREGNDLPLFELAEGFAAGMRAGRAARDGGRG